MKQRDYPSFHKEFCELAKKHNVSAYSLVLLVNTEGKEEGLGTVVLSKVAPEEEVWVFMEKTRQILFGLVRSLFAIAEPFFDLGPEATLGMLQGMLTDIADDHAVEEIRNITDKLEAEECPPLPTRSKKAKPEWH
jgi:hypothetical protein